MSNLAQKKMLKAYFQMASPLFFLMSFFSAPRENFYEGESVEIDIVRSGEQVSVAMSDIKQGYRENTHALSTNKEFKPPAHKESIQLNSFSLLDRNSGQDPFQQVGYRAKLLDKILRSTRPVADKILRSMEWQASQVLQTGVVSLTDENGNPTFEIDYKPKSSHFPTAGTAWGTAGGDPIGDIIALSNIITADGKRRPTVSIWGEAAYESLFAAAGGLGERLNFRRANTVDIVPMKKNSEMGIFRGILEVGNTRLEIFTYDARYDDPQTGNSTDFVDPAKVILLSGGRLDATFGGVPNIGQLLGVTGNRVVGAIPRLSSGKAATDLHVNAWVDNSGENLTVGIASRPLMIPTAIDSFGCIDTQATL